MDDSLLDYYLSDEMLKEFESLLAGEKARQSYFKQTENGHKATEDEDNSAETLLANSGIQADNRISSRENHRRRPYLGRIMSRREDKAKAKSSKNVSEENHIPRPRKKYTSRLSPSELSKIRIDTHYVYNSSDKISFKKYPNVLERLEYLYEKKGVKAEALKGEIGDLWKKAARWGVNEIDTKTRRIQTGKRTDVRRLFKALNKCEDWISFAKYPGLLDRIRDLMVQNGIVGSIDMLKNYTDHPDAPKPGTVDNWFSGVVKGAAYSKLNFVLEILGSSLKKELAIVQPDFVLEAHYWPK